MGQYYKPCMIDDHKKVKSWIYSHDYDNGLKLMEHSYLGNNMMQAIMNLLKVGGLWYKQRIVWAGDYADPEFIGDKNQHANLYDMCKDSKKIHPTDRLVNPMYLVNHTKNLYVDLTKLPKDPDNWCVHPLSLLTAEGNGRGGGDYRVENPYVGTWARHRLSAELEGFDVSKFKEIVPNFIMD